MEKSNSVKNEYQCPFCKLTVPGADFILSMRLIEGSNPPKYKKVRLCRKCRDSGL